MSLTLSQIQALLPEWQELCGARLQQIRSPDTQGLQLDFYQTPKRLSLLLDLSQGQSWLLQQPHSQAGETHPSAWVMLLRKHLLNQRLVRLEMPHADRLLTWTFGNACCLIMELSGRHANLWLCNANQQVLGSARSDRSQRALKTGQAYQLPQAVPPRRIQSLRQDVLKLADLPADGQRNATIWNTYIQQKHRWVQGQLVTPMLRALQQQQNRLKSRLQQAWQQLEKGEQAKDWQQQGELLRAAFGQVTPGQQCIRVTDYYHPNLTERVIALDPALDLAGNIQRCFQRARRCERAADYALQQVPQLESQLAETQRQLAQVQTWHSLLQAGQLLSATDAEAAEKRAKHWLKSPTTSGTQTSKQPRHQPAWHFTSLNGESIWVGKNARDNQQLLRQAKSSDFWLHLRDETGPHVIIPCAKNQQPHEQTLLDAATLALAYAKRAGGLADTGHGLAVARPEEGLKAEIWLARVHQLRQPKGAPAGRVQILPGARTLQLRLESDRLQRLLATRC